MTPRVNVPFCWDMACRRGKAVAVAVRCLASVVRTTGLVPPSAVTLGRGHVVQSGRSFRWWRTRHKLEQNTCYSWTCPGIWRREAQTVENRHHTYPQREKNLYIFNFRASPRMDVEPQLFRCSCLGEKNVCAREISNSKRRKKYWRKRESKGKTSIR